MKHKSAPFIVLEGLDGSGTTTQAKLLHSYFHDSRISSFLTYEPTDGPAGKLIRDILSGRLYESPGGKRIMLSEKALCLLFAADRIEHSREIEQHKKEGSVVVCDRYILSSLAYQTLDPRISPEWVIDVNRGCSRPDLTIFLNVSADECISRLKGRKDMPTVYEKRETLRAIESNYEKMIGSYEEVFGTVISINGTGDPREIHEKIRAAVSSKFKDV